jgi:glycine/D-amino acid oxidase-like deaminating enzyme
VPVIRASRRGHDVVLAFGHGHLGLTLAPTTARIVAEIIGQHKDQAVTLHKRRCGKARDDNRVTRHPPG